MKLVIVKNMVCHRCILAVEEILKSAGIAYDKVDFGEIHLSQSLSSSHRALLNERLSSLGFELIDSHMSGLIEKIKRFTMMKARNEGEAHDDKKKLSVYLSRKLNHEYTYLSSIFSSVEGRTIENYFIAQRIEKAKELLVYDQLTLTEIAHELDYSSAAHLSGQFKKITGLTPSHFKSVRSSKRKSVDHI